MKKLKWFWATNQDLDSWNGPFDHAEDAIKIGLFQDTWEKLDYIYITTGRKALKKEKESWCEYDYVVDIENALKIKSSKTNKMPESPKIIF
ncbi:MAG: hypothetical protein AABY22_18735 [Nanoarchaeota archaeon]